jgi:hypothetical protein
VARRNSGAHARNFKRQLLTLAKAAMIKHFTPTENPTLVGDAPVSFDGEPSRSAPMSAPISGSMTADAGASDNADDFTGFDAGPLQVLFEAERALDKAVIGMIRADINARIDGVFAMVGDDEAAINALLPDINKRHALACEAILRRHPFALARRGKKNEAIIVERYDGTARVFFYRRGESDHYSLATRPNARLPEMPSIESPASH